MVRESIESVLRQEFKDFELVLVDDPSTDGSADILPEYSNRGTVLVREQNGGEMASRNSAVAVAGGEYIAFLDSDDEWFPWTLATYAEAIVPHDMPGVEQGRVKFYRNRQNSVWGTINVDWVERNQRMGTESEVVEVDCVDFAECIRNHGMPYYMKIDIEGADCVCLETLLEFDCRPSYVSIESERVSVADLLAENDLLQRLGYDQFAVVQQANIQAQIPPEPAREGKYVAYRFEPGASGLFGKEVPNRWMTRSELDARYRKIFVLIRYFGEGSWLYRTWVGRRLIFLMNRVLRSPIPGWYDTHARIRSGD